MSDQTVIFRALRSAPGVRFIEPNREIYMQDELHDAGRAALAGTDCYIGWHHQAHAFNGKGRLTGAQRVYFGGDFESVKRALTALEAEGYAVLGGRSADEAFLIRRDARPEHVDAALIDDWRTRLEVLNDPLLAPLREGEAALLHGIVASEDLRELLPQALEALRVRGALSDADLAVALSPEHRSRLGAAASAVVVHALQAEHPMAVPAVSALAEEGKADTEMLAAWGGPEAREAARDHALGRPGDVPREYLALVAEMGDDPIAAGVELAEAMRNAHPEQGDGVAARVVGALVERYGDASNRSRSLLMRDERCPLWLRVVAAEQATRGPSDPAQRAAYRTHRPDEGLSPEETAAWLDLVDAVRVEAGLPPSPGYDVSVRMWQDQAIEQREFMVARHLHGLRAALARDGLDEPAVAVLLDLLRAAGALDAETLDPLTADWKRRLFVKPSAYTSAAPAALTLAVACIAAQHPNAQEIVDAIAKDRRKWSEPTRHLLRGALDRGREADLLSEQELTPVANDTSGSAGMREAQHALSLVTARLRNTSPVRAACELAVAAPQRPLFVPLGFAAAAIALAEGGGELWSHSFQERSPRALRAALAVAADDSLSPEARGYVLHHADRSSVIDHPLERCRAVASALELAGLSEQRESLNAALGNR